MNYEYTNIVVGSSLRALLFAFQNNYPILFTKPQKPFRFDFMHEGVDLSSLKIPQDTRTLNTFGDKKVVGPQKLLLWERLIFLLSLDSKVPLSNLCDSLRCVDNKIFCSNEYSKIAEISFNNCYYFYDENTSGFVKEKTFDSRRYLCYDWVAFNRGGKHKIDYFETKDDLVHKVWFYSSDRIDGNTPVKDACVLSILTQEQIEHFDYSETMVRFKLIHEMEQRGMKGLFNGCGPNGKPKYYKFRTNSIGRDRRPQLGDSLTPFPSIEIPEVKEEDLLKNLSSTCVDYNRFLRYL